MINTIVRPRNLFYLMKTIKIFTSREHMFEKKYMSQYFIDGCFDGFHYGHVNAIFQAKTFCDKLILGTHTNVDMKTHKNIPLFDYKKLIFMIQYFKYISGSVL